MRHRVVLADDHPAFALGMRLGLDDHGFEVVGVAADGDQAVALSASEHPDVVILDVRMPRCSGLVACRRIMECDDAPLVVFLSTYDDAATLGAAHAAGARAFFHKETPIREIADGVRRLLGQPGLNLITPPHLPTLTGRELGVLRALGRGLSNKRIAEELGVGTETVKDYCSTLFGKLGVEDRVHAILEARRLGLLEG